jgi:hypothetical protein
MNHDVLDRRLLIMLAALLALAGSDLASRLVLPRQEDGHARRSPQRGRCRAPGPLSTSGQRC